MHGDHLNAAALMAAGCVQSAESAGDSGSHDTSPADPCTLGVARITTSQIFGIIQDAVAGRETSSSDHPGNGEPKAS